MIKSATITDVSQRSSGIFTRYYSLSHIQGLYGTRGTHSINERVEVGEDDEDGEGRADTGQAEALAVSNGVVGKDVKDIRRRQ